MKADYDRRHRVMQSNGPFLSNYVWILDPKREGTGDVRRKRRMKRNDVSNPITPLKPVSLPLIPLSIATPEVAQHIDQPEKESPRVIEQQKTNDVADQLILRRSQRVHLPSQRYVDEY